MLATKVNGAVTERVRYLQFLRASIILNVSFAFSSTL